MICFIQRYHWFVFFAAAHGSVVLGGPHSQLNPWLMAKLSVYLVQQLFQAHSGFLLSSKVAQQEAKAYLSKL